MLTRANYHFIQNGKQICNLYLHRNNHPDTSHGGFAKLERFFCRVTNDCGGILVLMTRNISLPSRDKFNLTRLKKRKVKVTEIDSDYIRGFDLNDGDKFKNFLKYKCKNLKVKNEII